MPPRARRRKTLSIGVPIFEGVNGLDLMGPIEAFSTARLPGRPGAEGSPYSITLVGVNAKAVAAESGALLLPNCRIEEAPPFDTIIVPGGPGLRERSTNARWANWLRERAPRTRRIASVCTGLYGLAASGLVDGLSVTTHWRWADAVAEHFPALKVDPTALFIRQGKFYTGGGITAGIDLALAMIEEDFGPAVALAIAREMNVYLKRSGGQSQYSEPLKFQTRGADRFADLVAWITANLHQDLSIETLAARACLSPRQFSRRFTGTYGCTPADFVERLRLDEARERLINTADTIDRVADSLGFGSSDVFRRRFATRFGVPPREYREHFTSTLAAPTQH